MFAAAPRLDLHSSIHKALRRRRPRALFVAATLEPLPVEETQHHALLAPVASAVGPAARAARPGAMHQHVPPEAMRGVLEIVRPHLNDTARGTLARGLRIPIAPGRVCA
jgi:hypothetical protein